MSDRVIGKVTLITGGASGIGRGCADLFAAEGATVVIADVDEAMGTEAEAEIRAAGGRCEFAAHDVTDEQSWISLIAGIRDRHGRLDALVNNAGIAIRNLIVDMPLEDWRKQMAVNLDGVFLGVKHALPLMRLSGDGGSIINMSSIAGLKGTPSSSCYSATKGGVRLFTKAAALECAAARDGVRVNSMHPGIIDTPMWLSTARVKDPGINAPPDLSDMVERSVPLGIVGTSLDIANGVLWLASDESRYVTGAELVIDGGLTLR